MITGYNTDVRHNEVVFHVQTEDKGIANPFIESLVYVGGQVLASKRASYADLLAEGKEKEILALMDHQHRTMIAAIRHGKLDGKLAELMSSRQTGQHPKVEARPVPAPPPRPDTSVRPAPGPVSPPAPPAAAPRPAAPASASPPNVPPASAPPPPTAARPAPPASAPPRPAAPARERTLDQVILEYLTNEADQEQLVLLVEEERDLALGRRATLTLRATSSKSGAPVVGAQVAVRMISTVSEPRVLANGRTDDGGVLSLVFDIPHPGRGTAALIITAVGSIGRAELKHLL